MIYSLFIFIYVILVLSSFVYIFWQYMYYDIV